MIHPDTKLDNDQRMFVLRMYAEGHSLSNIQGEIKSKYGIKMTVHGIKCTCEAMKHEPFVTNFREVYLANIRAVPIANKRIRIDDLEKIRIRLNTLILENKGKSKSDKAALLAEIRRLNETLAVAREEMEKKPQFIANVAIGNLGGLSDEELHRKKQDLIGTIRKSFDGAASRNRPDTEDIAAEDSE